MSLRDYLQKAYKEVHLGWDEVQRTIAHIDATLRPNQDNIILLYGGSFNPPHRGHLDVLLSALRPEAGVAAIVVLPCEDYLLRNKMANNPSSFFLDRVSRTAIWESIDGIPKDKVWVWTDTFFPFKAMIEAVVRLAAADGYRLVFSHLIGPDNLRMHDPLTILPYVCDGIFVSNKARHISAQFCEDATPVVWGGFGPWTRSDVVMESDMGEAVLWTCNSAEGDANQRKRGYYLEYAQPNAVDINSTSLRETLSKSYCCDEASLSTLGTQGLMRMLKVALEAGCDQ